MQCLELDSHGNGFAEVGATLLNNGPKTGSQFANVKGRLNFEMSPGATGLEPQHIVTLVDSNPAKTLATSLFRPSNDANDTYIGLDNGNVVRSLAQLAFGAPAAISLYIRNTGDNASYLERLTAAAKIFNVPVTINGNLTVTGTCTGCGGGGGGSGKKIASTAYVRSEIYMAWTCAVAGTTAVSQHCNWTVPAGLTVTGFDLAASTAAAGCTTYPVLQVWDGTSGAEVGSYSTVFTPGTNFYAQVTGSTSLTSGHQLRLKITTAAAGCTTNAAGIVATVTYQMQN
jgi:hypothetical protein